MFGTLGGPELFLIFVVALIVFGPRKLPDIGKSLGRMMSEFRRASNEFKSTIESEVESEKIKESMRIEPPKVKPVKAKPPETAMGAAVAAADGVEASPDAEREADEPTASDEPVEPDSPAESPGEQATSAGDPSTEPVPETVSRQPPAPAQESK